MRALNNSNSINVEIAALRIVLIVNTEELSNPSTRNAFNSKYIISNFKLIIFE